MLKIFSSCDCSHCGPRDRRPPLLRKVNEHKPQNKSLQKLVFVYQIAKGRFSLLVQVSSTENQPGKCSSDTVLSWMLTRYRFKSRLLWKGSVTAALSYIPMQIKSPASARGCPSSASISLINVNFTLPELRPDHLFGLGLNFVRMHK